MVQKITGIEQLLDWIEQADDDGGDISLDSILDKIGHRSFGPILLVGGLITLAPIIGDIPGVPTIMGIFVFLTAAQLLFHRDHLWLPDWLLQRSVEQAKLEKGLEWMRSLARYADRLIKPRLTILVQGTGSHIIAIVCILIAAVMPALEFIPFSANAAGIALTAFGLSLIAQDGLMALLAFLFSAGTFGWVIYYFF